MSCMGRMLDLEGMLGVLRTLCPTCASAAAARLYMAYSSRYPARSSR